MLPHQHVVGSRTDICEGHGSRTRTGTKNEGRIIYRITGINSTKSNDVTVPQVTGGSIPCSGQPSTIICPPPHTGGCSTKCSSCITCGTRLNQIPVRGCGKTYVGTIGDTRNKNIPDLQRASCGII
jgi:hypothetical protein